MRSSFSILCGVVVSLLATTGGAIAAPAAPAASAALASRILEFPADVSLGRLTILPKGFNVCDRHLGGKPFCEARGRVTVPPGAKIMLNAADALSEHAAALDKLPPDALVALELERASVGDVEVAHLSRFTGLRWLDLHETDISDKGLRLLGNLTELAFLDVSHTTIRGASFADLKRMKKLMYLDIGFNNLEPGAFALLASDNLPSLLFLKSSANNLTDDTIGCFDKFVGVTELELTDQKGLTDRCMLSLKSMKKLRVIDVRRTRVTLRGLAALKGKPLRSITLTVASPKLEDEKFVEKALPGVRVGLDKKREADYSLYAPTHF